MEQKKDRLYPSAPLENNDLEQQLEKKLNDANSFINHISNIKKMIACFKEKKHESKQRFKNYKTLNTILESVDTVLIIGSTTTSVTQSVTGVGLIVVPFSARIACSLSLGNKLLHKVIIKKYIKYKNQFEQDQQIIKTFDKLYKKSSKDNVIDKSEIESLRFIFTECLDEMKNESIL